VSPVPTPLERAARQALYGTDAGPPPMSLRFPQTVALAARIHAHIETLRRLDLDGVAPATVFHAADTLATASQESAHAAL
jgi:hypothetical protein